MRTFVYGTLKRGHYNSKLLGRSKYICDGVGIGTLYITKTKLPLLLEEDSGNRVYGEIWDISKEDYDYIAFLEEGAGYYEGEIVVKIKGKSEFELCKVFYYDGFLFDKDRAEKILEYTLDKAL